MKDNLDGMQQHRFVRKYIGIKNDKGIFLKILKIFLVNLNLKSKVLMGLPIIQECHISGH